MAARTGLAAFFTVAPFSFLHSYSLPSISVGRRDRVTRRRRLRVWTLHRFPDELVQLAGWSTVRMNEIHSLCRQNYRAHGVGRTERSERWRLRTYDIFRRQLGSIWRVIIRRGVPIADGRRNGVV